MCEVCSISRRTCCRVPANMRLFMLYLDSIPIEFFCEKLICPCLPLLSPKFNLPLHTLSGRLFVPLQCRFLTCTLHHYHLCVPIIALSIIANRRGSNFQDQLGANSVQGPYQLCYILFMIGRLFFVISWQQQANQQISNIGSN